MIKEVYWIITVILVTTLLTLNVNVASANSFPEKPIRLIVPFAPGGPADSAARKLAAALLAELGQQIIVDNKVGGGGIIAANSVISAPADGYVLLFGAASSLAFSRKVNPIMTYDALEDLSPVSLTHIFPLFYIVPSESPAKTLDDFVELAKMRPGTMNYGSAGTGTTSHLCVEALKIATKISITHIPYRGSNPAMADLLANRLDLMCDAFTAQRPHVLSGAERVLAIASKARSNIYPAAPPASESGVTGLEIASWFAIMAPKGTSMEVRDRLASAITKVHSSSEMKTWGISMGVEAVSSTPTALAKFLIEERNKWEELIIRAKIKLN